MASFFVDEKRASSEPFLSSMRVIYRGSECTPLLEYVEYALTISSKLISEVPRKIEGTGSIWLSIPIFLITSITDSGLNCFINQADIKLTELASPHFKVTILPSLSDGPEFLGVQVVSFTKNVDATLATL